MTASSEVEGVVVCIAVGNSLRGDDGVAQRALQLVRPRDGLRLLAVHQLTPDLAPEIAGAGAVFLLDADPTCTETTLLRIEAGQARGTPLTHSLNPAELLELARRLYKFAGEAFLCRIPATRFEHAQELSLQADAAARSAAKMIEDRLKENCPIAP